MTADQWSRRAFLERLLSLAALPGALALSAGGAAPARAARTPSDTQSADEQIFLRTYGQASAQALADRPFGEAVAAIGMLFVGTPYIAHSLELPGKERLVTNLQAFDCTTFVENVLALARCFRRGQRSFDAFREQLTMIRYRSGRIDGYPSRLHYFSDWLQDNEHKRIVRDVTLHLGGVAGARTFNFMSTHPGAYRQLADARVLARIRQTERALSAHPVAVVPKEKLPETARRIASGDVIGIATSLAGIDVSHIGLAAESGGVVRFLHAPLSGGAVELSATSLVDYVQAHTTSTGVIIGRPVEP